MLEAILANEEETEALGRRLAAALAANEAAIRATGINLRLEGNLGAGKTCLTRSVLRALGVTGRVRSPTFTLLEPYTALGMPFSHFDFYRFEDPAEFEEAGFRESFGEGRITFSEWSIRAEGCLPDADLTVELVPEGDGRLARISAHSPAGSAVLESMK